MNVSIHVVDLIDEIVFSVLFIYVIPLILLIIVVIFVFLYSRSSSICFTAVNLLSLSIC